MTTTNELEPPAPSTLRENLITAIGGTLVVLGGFIDGYAHTELIDPAEEDFFTLWHAILYSGFAVTASWIGWMAYQRASAQPIRTWFPTGYGLAVIGIGIFSLGGFGDAIWHTVFGIGKGIDALVSPTHIVLLVGLMLILTAPLRSALAADGDTLGWKSALPTVLSLMLTTSMIAFYSTFIWGLSRSWTLGIPYEGPGDDGVIGRAYEGAGAEGTAIAYGFSAGYISTIILLLPVLVLLRRWTVPFGAVVLLWVVPSTLEWLAFGSEKPGTGAATGAAFVGAIVFELTIVWLGPKLNRRHVVVWASSLGMTALWTARYFLIATGDDVDVQWTTELWTGQIVLSGLIAFGLALVTVPGDRDLAGPKTSRS